MAKENIDVIAKKRLAYVVMANLLFLFGLIGGFVSIRTDNIISVYAGLTISLALALSGDVLLDVANRD